MSSILLGRAASRGDSHAACDTARIDAHIPENRQLIFPWYATTLMDGMCNTTLTVLADLRHICPTVTQNNWGATPQ